MVQLLWMWLPDGMIPLVLVGLGLALTVGLVSRAAAGRVLGAIVLMLLLSPFVVALMERFPLWLLLLLMAWFILSTARLLLNSLFGRGATDHFVGSAMWAGFTAPFRILRWIVARR